MFFQIQGPNKAKLETKIEVDYCHNTVMADKCNGQTYWDVAYQVKLRRKKIKMSIFAEKYKLMQTFHKLQGLQGPGEIEQTWLIFDCICTNE